jgi:agmatine deiminase
MNAHSAWPAARGYRMPAEWALHQGTWLSWPHNRDTWPGCFDGVEPAMVRVVAALAASEPVHINVLDETHARHVARVLDRAVPPERGP